MSYRQGAGEEQVKTELRQQLQFFIDEHLQPDFVACEVSVCFSLHNEYRTSGLIWTITRDDLMNIGRPIFIEKMKCLLYRFITLHNKNLMKTRL